LVGKSEIECQVERLCNTTRPFRQSPQAVASMVPTVSTGPDFPVECVCLPGLPARPFFAQVPLLSLALINRLPHSFLTICNYNQLLVCQIQASPFAFCTTTYHFPSAIAFWEPFLLATQLNTFTSLLVFIVLAAPVLPTFGRLNDQR
jgi:hypothetical protein